MLDPEALISKKSHQLKYNYYLFKSISQGVGVFILLPTPPPDISLWLKNIGNNTCRVIDIVLTGGLLAKFFGSAEHALETTDLKNNDTAP